MANRPYPYVPKEPGDIIRSGDWNELQIKAREEIQNHRHTGGEEGTLIPRAGIEEKAIDGSRIDAEAEVKLKTLTISDGLEVKGKLTLGGVDDLLANFKSLHSGGIDPEAEVKLKTLTISGNLKVNGQFDLGKVTDLLTTFNSYLQTYEDRLAKLEKMLTVVPGTFQGYGTPISGNFVKIAEFKMMRPGNYTVKTYHTNPGGFSYPYPGPLQSGIVSRVYVNDIASAQSSEHITEAGSKVTRMLVASEDIQVNIGDRIQIYAKKRDNNCPSDGVIGELEISINLEEIKK